MGRAGRFPIPLTSHSETFVCSAGLRAYSALLRREQTAFSHLGRKSVIYMATAFGRLVAYDGSLQTNPQPLKD